jgi:DNA polymerase/3'-5' exonuclease PolX
VRALSNGEIADVFERIAGLLEAQDGGGYRIQAYRAAAAFARAHGEPLVEVLARDGRAGLVALPTIGDSLARLIEELARTGHARLLARLEGEVTAEALFDALPGVGHELAERIHATLHVETLEELERAAHDGRLETVPGIGPHRAVMIRNALAARLRDDARFRARAVEHHAPSEPPPVALLLELDGEYRRRAAAGELRKIAPRRFNPAGEAWHPLLHVEREGRGRTAHFSNTARAPQLGRTRDWVVIWPRLQKCQLACRALGHFPLLIRRVDER